jgi:formylglycine-generating enzyme required for sulfatase activity
MIRVGPGGLVTLVAIVFVLRVSVRLVSAATNVIGVISNKNNKLMYSEKLEEVISAALADGNLTEQKRNIIMRRAEKEGEDVEEVMMIVESRLLSQGKVQPKQATPKSEAEEKADDDGDFVETVNCVSFKMVKVEGGKFTMFSKSQDASIPAKPQEVVLDDYYICETVVTQELWKAVMGINFPLLDFIGDKLPVNNLTWEECYQFINKLNALTNKNYHLPSEAQWEYAAIGGKKSHGYKYAGSDNLKEVGWASINEMKPVAQLRPNELGLYDMSGNCYEFCEDNMVEEPILNRTKNPIVRTMPKGFRILRSTPFDSPTFNIGDRNWCP